MEISHAQGHRDPELCAEQGSASKAEFSVSKSGMLVILMKLSYPLYHLYKCTKKNKSGYNYLPFCGEQENVCRWKTTFLNYQEEAQQPKTLNSLQGRNISYKPCQTANLLQSELKLHEHSKDTAISKGKGRRSVT